MNIINPYRPLKSLSVQDSRIFSGREKDINYFTKALLSPKTKVMILHGGPGAGKSSFLHAGLVPKLNSLNFPFKKFDILNFNKEKVLSCSYFSVNDIANAVFHSKWKESIIDHRNKAGIFRKLFFIVKKIQNRYIYEDTVIEHLTSSMISEDEFEKFLKRKDGISIFFRILSFCSPCTKILIIDHVEQIFTLLDDESKNDIDLFLDGIRYFSKYDCDAKIILSIRTEFLDQLRTGIYDQMFAENVRDMRLKDINDEEKLIDVIKKPCSESGYAIENNAVKHILDTAKGIKSEKSKEQKNISILVVLHIISYFSFEIMLNRIKNEPNKKMLLLSDAYNLCGNNYMQLVSLFVENKILNIECVFNKKYEKTDIRDIIYFFLYIFLDVNFRCRRVVKKNIFKNKLLKKYQDLQKNNKSSIDALRIYKLLRKEKIIIYIKNKDRYLTLSHDLFAEAVLFLKTGLLNVFENKRDPGIENAMENIFSEFQNAFRKYPSEKLRISSIVGKQFFHENDKLYKQLNDLLCKIKDNNLDAENTFIKVLIAKPFSKLFLYRAESEIGINLDEFRSNYIHDYIWKWEPNRIFHDSAITIARLSILVNLYKNIIDVRFSDFMPISMLTYRNQSVFNPYTFAAHEKKNDSGEEWLGSLPTYHHVLKESYKNELGDHFEYLWNKGLFLKDFLQELKCDRECEYREHKKNFLDLLKEKGLDYELI